MRYAQLRAFHHVALTGGFSRAAEQLCLTQPAISDQVRKLETEYDTRLFDRSGHRVVLTAQGRTLFGHTSRLFEAETGAREFLTETRAELEGQLRIIADSAFHVADILRRFRDSHPRVRIWFRSGNTEEVIRSLTDFDAEIGVVGNLETHDSLTERVLGTSPIVAIVSAGHVLAAQGAASLAELAGYPVVFRESGSKTRQKVTQAASRAGVRLEPDIEAEGREAVREIVAAGLGVGFVSDAEFVPDQRLAKLGIWDSSIAMEEKLICLRQRQDSSMIRAFMGFAAC